MHEELVDRSEKENRGQKKCYYSMVYLACLCFYWLHL